LIVAFKIRIAFIDLDRLHSSATGERFDVHGDDVRTDDDPTLESRGTCRQGSVLVLTMQDPLIVG